MKKNDNIVIADQPNHMHTRYMWSWKTGYMQWALNWCKHGSHVPDPQVLTSCGCNLQGNSHYKLNISLFWQTKTPTATKPWKLQQFHFTSWPDHAVPEYATSMLSFHRRVVSQHKTSKGPMLVHCR